MKAIAVLTYGNIKGYILFEENMHDNDTIIRINLTNVPTGYHGIHIHKYGDLTDNCNSLCQHYNPFDKNHGSRMNKNRHVGDLGNIKPDKYGRVIKTFRDKIVKVRGKYSIIGRSIVIHDKKDDLGRGNNMESLITGNSGKRIACGVIGYCR